MVYTTNLYRAISIGKSSVANGFGGITPSPPFLDKFIESSDYGDSWCTTCAGHDLCFVLRPNRIAQCLSICMHLCIGVSQGYCCIHPACSGYTIIYVYIYMYITYTYYSILYMYIINTYIQSHVLYLRLTSTSSPQKASALISRSKKLGWDPPSLDKPKCDFAAH